MIDLTLARLKRPALADFNPVFGTVVTKTDRNKGGLSTEEVDANMALSYELMREVEVYNSDETSKIEYDAKMAFMGDNPITLTVKNATYAGCTIQITHRGSQPCQIQWNDTEVLDMVRGDTLNLIWNETQWDRINNKNSSTTDANGVNYTFVVDSDESLREWAENSRINNQDYTAVLIRRGTWTSTTGVNLTTTGTKVVQGEPGSKLVFNEVNNGLYYDELPTTSDYWMRDVTVESNASGSGDNFAFYNCYNLINCSASGTADNANPEYDDCTGVGFSSCRNLTNCTGAGICIRSGGSAYGAGFSSCRNLTNCSGFSNGVKGTNAGFDGCNNLTNCTGSSSGSYNNSGFSSCRNLTNCTGIGGGAGTTYGQGFRSSQKLTNCTGTGIGDNAGYGFNQCNSVFGCKKGSTCTTTVFYSSYASVAYTSTYACADTPNGGFNDTTN